MAHPNLEIDVLLEQDGALPSTAEEIVRGLRESPRTLPSKYFYDERGSELFEQITELPEYYPTRTEQGLLDVRAGEIAALAAPAELAELGSGSARKTQVLIDAARAQGDLRRFVLLEVSEAMAKRAAERLALQYPGLEVRAVVGDFERHMDEIPAGARRLAVFLGGTIGNFVRPQAVAFLSKVARLVRPDGSFLLGTDLVKDRAVLEAAYNDSRGVTAEFNRNILRVVNRYLDGDFDPQAFEHVAFYDEEHQRIEMHLRSVRRQTVRLRAAELELSFARGEMVRTEVSHKYTRESVERMLDEAGLRLRRWLPDPRDYFALSLSTPA